MKHTNSPLLQFEDNWETEMGGVIAGERVVVKGKNLFTELGDFSWKKLLLLMITGREFSSKDTAVLDNFWAMTISYPDPRIWNNRVAGLAGTARSTAHLGVAASCAVAEGKIFGGQANLAGIDFIIDCAQKVEQGQDLEAIVRHELKTRRAIYGYGRPVTKADERIKPMEEVISKHDYDKGKHVSLAYKIDHILRNGRWRMQMNIAGLGSAVFADMGFTPREYYLWLVNGYHAGSTACYIDANQKPEGSLFPLSCNRISYEGLGKRNWD